MPQEEKTTIGRRGQNGETRDDDGQNDSRYDAHRIETKWLERWQNEPSLYAADFLRL